MIAISPLTQSLECSLCLSLICEPISISCGHSFCRVCLVKSLRRHKKRCPQCREVCHLSPETSSENIMIKSLAMQLEPEKYAERQRECAEEKSSWKATYPIFFFNSVQFPGSRLSLHLFEPRYKVMMQRIVDTSKSFVYIANFDSFTASEGDVALIAELEEVEFLPDGRCLLEATLKNRARVVDTYVEEGTQGLHFCSVEPMSDEPLVERQQQQQRAQRQQQQQGSVTTTSTTTNSTNNENTSMNQEDSVSSGYDETGIMLSSTNVMEATTANSSSIISSSQSVADSSGSVEDSSWGSTAPSLEYARELVQESMVYVNQMILNDPVVRRNVEYHYGAMPNPNGDPAAFSLWFASCTPLQWGHDSRAKLGLLKSTQTVQRLELCNHMWKTSMQQRGLAALPSMADVGGMIGSALQGVAAAISGRLGGGGVSNDHSNAGTASTTASASTTTGRSTGANDGQDGRATDDADSRSLHTENESG